MRSAAARLWWQWFPLGSSFAWLQLRSDPLRFAAAVAGIAFAAVMVTFQLGLYQALTEGAVITHKQHIIRDGYVYICRALADTCESINNLHRWLLWYKFIHWGWQVYNLALMLDIIPT